MLVLLRNEEYPFELLDERTSYEVPVYHRHQSQSCLFGVTVVRSTGFAELDTSAVAALRQWRWKPGKWKEIEMAVEFTRP
jgi:hypothetical protein